jgi:hypothetical protein
MPQRKHQTVHPVQRREIADLQAVLEQLGRKRRGVVMPLWIVLA